MPIPFTFGSRRPARAMWRRQGHRRTRLSLEPLEGRSLPSGTVVIQTDSSDSDNDGVVDAVTTLTQEFDNNDNLIRKAFAADNNADGVADFRESYAAEFDNRENLIREDWARDDDADGTPEWGRT